VLHKVYRRSIDRAGIGLSKKVPSIGGKMLVASAIAGK